MLRSLDRGRQHESPPTRRQKPLYGTVVIHLGGPPAVPLERWSHSALEVRDSGTPSPVTTVTPVLLGLTIHHIKDVPSEKGHEHEP